MEHDTTTIPASDCGDRITYEQARLVFEELAARRFELSRAVGSSDHALLVLESAREAERLASLCNRSNGNHNEQVPEELNARIAQVAMFGH